MKFIKMIWNYLRFGKYHIHDYTYFNVTYVEDVSFGRPGPVRTEALKRCSICGNIKRQTFDHCELTLDQLNNENK